MARTVNFGDYYGTVDFPDEATDADVISHYNDLEAKRQSSVQLSKLKLQAATDEVERQQPTFGKLAVLTGYNIGEGAAGTTKQAVGNIARSVADVFDTQARNERRMNPAPAGMEYVPVPEHPLNILREAGKDIEGEGSGQLKEAQYISEQLGGGLPGKIATGLASAAGASAPALLAAPLGLPAAALAGGVQSYGSNLSQFRDMIQARNPKLSEEEAFQQAQVPAAITGVATAVLTRTFGGVERFVDRIAKEGLKQTGVKALLREGFKTASLEFPEEALDQLTQGLTEKAFINPDKDVGEILNEAGMAGLTGFALGGLTTGAIAGPVTAAQSVAGAVDRSRVRRQSAKDSEARVKKVVTAAELEGQTIDLTKVPQADAAERERLRAMGINVLEPGQKAPDASQTGTPVKTPSQEEAPVQEAVGGVRVRDTAQARVEAQAETVALKEAGFGGYQYSLPMYTIPGVRPGIVRHVSAETAQKAGYTVPATIPTMEQWQAAGSPTVAPVPTATKEKDVTDLADSVGVKWDYDSAFMARSKALTGKEHLSEMSPVELKTVYDDLAKTGPIDTVARAPSTPEQVVADVQAYNTVQVKMREMMKTGNVSSPEFLALWKENETIKNRHGGMPPVLPPQSQASPAERPIRTDALHSLAVSDPARAVQRAQQNNATPQELAYLGSVLKDLSGKTDRFITPQIRQRALEASQSQASPEQLVTVKDYLTVVLPQQQAQAPINWQEFATKDNEGYNAIDPAKIREQLITGKLQGGTVNNQLLTYLLRDSSLHPLNPIRIIDLSPQELKDISDVASPAGQGAYRGLFTTRTMSNKGNIEILTKNSNGTPVSQASFVQTLAHELVHNNITSKIRQASPGLRMEAEDIFKFVTENSQGTEWVGNNALLNIDEFFSEAMTDPRFQGYLSSLDYGSTGKANVRRSAFSAIMDLIKRIFKLPDFITTATGQNVDMVTVLEQVFSTAGRLEQVQRRAQVAVEVAKAPAEDRPAFFSTRQEVEAMAANPGLDAAQQQEVRDLAAVQSSMSPDNLVGWLMGMPVSKADQFAKNKLAYIEDRRHLSTMQQNLASMPETTPEEIRAKEVAGATILGHYGVDRNMVREIDAGLVKDQLAMAKAAPKLAGMNNERLKASFLTALFNHLTSDYRTYLNNLASAIPANENAQAQYRQRLVDAERRLNEHQQSPIAVQHALSAIASTMPANLTTNQQVVDWALQQNVLQGVVGDNVRSWLLVDDGSGSPALLGYSRLLQDMSDLRDVLTNQNNLASDIDAFEQWFRTSGNIGKIPAKLFAEKYFKFRTGRDRALKIASAIDKEVGDLDTRIHGAKIARDRLDTMMTDPAYVSTVRDASERAHVVVRAIMDSSDGKTGNGLIDRESNVGLWRMKGPMTGADYVVDIHPSTAQEAQNKQALSAFVAEARDYATQNKQTDPLVADQYSDLADYIERYLLHPSLDPSQGFVQMPWMQIPGTTIRLTADPFDWASSGLTMIGFTNRTVRDAIERIGGRPVRQAMSDAYELDRVMRKVQGLESDPKFGFDAQTRAVIAAIKSHGWSMDQFSQWDEMVAEKFLAAGQNNLGVNYNVGEVIVGSEGVRLTREDVAALRLMKKFSSAVQAAAPAHVAENIGNLGVLRKAVGFGEYTMARLPQSWTHTFVNNWDKLSNDAAKLSSLQDGRDFQRVVMGYIGEFNPELNRMNPASRDKSSLFEIYRKMALLEKQGVQSFSNLDEVLDFIADQMVARNMSPDHVTARNDAQTGLISEINDFIKAFQNNVLNQQTDAVWNGKPDPIIQVATANNAFTTPRGTLQAPSTFYAYSLATDGRRRGYVGGLRSLLNLKVIQSMREALSAMRNKKSEMQDAIEEQIRAGIPSGTAKKNVIKQTSKERRAGEIRFDYREIDTASRYLSSVLEQMERVEVSNPDHYQHPGIEAVQNAASTLKAGLLASTQAISTNTWGGLLLGPATLHWQTGQWGRAMRDILPFPVGGNARVTETLFKMVSSMVAGNPIMAKLLKKHAPLWNSLSEIIVNASADWAKVQRTAQMNGMVTPYNLRQKLANQSELKGAAGRFVGETDPGAVATFFNTVLSAPGIRHVSEPFKAIFPRKFDDFINYSLILGFDKDLDMLKKRGWNAFKKREDAAVPGYDWKNLSDPSNILTPEEMGIGSHKGLNRWQELFAPLGSLDSVLLDYYEKTKDMTPEQREATPLIPDENDYAGLALYHAGVSNVATETNRPQSYKGRGSEGFLRSTAGTFAGWGANFMHQLSKGLQTYSKDSQYNRIANNMIGLAVIFILLASVGAWNWEFGDELTKLVTNMSSARIQIGNATQDPRTAMGYLAQALVNVVPVAGPIIGSVAGLAFTGRGSPLDATSQVLHLNFAADTYRTAKRILQTGDITLPMADWTRRWVFPPLTGSIMNRMPILRGLVDQQNAIRSLNGSAPPGTEIKWGRGSGEMRYGPANDEIVKLIAAAYEAVAHGGSLQEVDRRRNDAIAAFVKTGRSEEDAIKAVDAALAAKEPIRVLTGKEFTEEEAARWIARMTLDQKKDYDRAVAAWELLGSVTGKDLNMVAQVRGGGGGGIPSIQGIQSSLGQGIGSMMPAIGYSAPAAGYLRRIQSPYGGTGTSRIRSPLGRRRAGTGIRRRRVGTARRRLGPRIARRNRVKSVLGTRRRRAAYA